MSRRDDTIRWVDDDELTEQRRQQEYWLQLMVEFGFVAARPRMNADRVPHPADAEPVLRDQADNALTVEARALLKEMHAYRAAIGAHLVVSTLEHDFLFAPGGRDAVHRTSAPPSQPAWPDRDDPRCASLISFSILATAAELCRQAAAESTT